MIALDENDPTEGTEFGSAEFFASLDSAMDGVVDAAPSDIKDAAEDVRSVFSSAADAANELGADADPAALEGVMDQLENADAAMEQIDQYMEANCEG